MSQPGDGPPAGPSAARPQVEWPTTAPAHRTLRPGDPTDVGPYRLEAVLGEGGMGRVFLGRTPAGSAVAVKLVHREYAADQAFRKRFEREAGTARLVHGLYTVPVVDADLQADEPWLATAYIPGPSLQHAVTEHGPLPVEATLTLIARVAEALQSIHVAGVIHRDLKPSNVILTVEGPKVIDFGIARAADATSITGTGVQPGTPAYMAPEHVLGQPLTPAADIFALGVLAHFAATGELAFGGGSAPVVIHRIVEMEPNLDGCPEPIRAIVTACLTKDPQQRPTPAEVIHLCRQAPTTIDGTTDGDGYTSASPPSFPPTAPGAAPVPDASPNTPPRPSIGALMTAAVAGLVGGVADLLVAVSGGYAIVTVVGFPVDGVLLGSMVGLAARLVAGVVMLGGGALLLRRRAVGRPVLATGAGLAVLTIVAIDLGVIKVAIVPSPVTVVFQYSALIGAIVALSTVFTRPVSTALNGARDHRRPGAPAPHNAAADRYPPGQNAPGVLPPVQHHPGGPPTRLDPSGGQPPGA
jgi:protein kinase-like protein